MIRHTSDKIYSVLKNEFGFDSFLPGQKKVLRDIFQGKHVVAIMPTGGGKSLLYQLPSLLFPGVTVVISPLISLMKDQVDGLIYKGIKSTFINSSLSPEEKVYRTDRLREGYWDIIYIAPERIRDRSFMALLKNSDVSLLAVDEAHCISQWGHDFRPDYLALADLRKVLNNPLTVALTATATRKVRDDIAHHLELDAWTDHVEGFDRENLFFRVTETGGYNEKYEEILRCLKQMKGSGIIYSATRKHTEEVCDTLRSQGVAVIAYHGGLGDNERKSAQDLFMNGEVRVVSATNAFGMGIDKQDIRFVIHFDIPGSLEAYYQEVGRAGRDGNISLCHLLFSYADVRIQEFFIRESNPSSEAVRQAWSSVEERPTGALVPDMQYLSGTESGIAKSSILNMFDKSGFTEKIDAATRRIVRMEGYKENMNRLIKSGAEKYRYDTAKLKKMVSYAYNRGCRRNWILDYFGDSSEHAGCRACDNYISADRSEAIDGKQLATVRDILKAVKSLNGRFGRKKTAQFIKGSRASWITDRGYSLMDTYGVCAELQVQQIEKMLESLTEAGCLRVFITDEGYPLVEITGHGRKVLEGTAECRMEFPENSTQTKISQQKKENMAHTADFSHGLFELLRIERTRIASERNVPPYVVFHDSALEQMASLQPASSEEFLEVKGVGERKLKQYGTRFLKIIGEWQETKQ